MPAAVPKAESVKPVGDKEFAYSFEVRKDGAAEKVPENFGFRSGDRFRLIFKPGFPAHVYLLNRGPKEEHYKLLFPSSEIHVTNPLPAGNEARIPESSWMHMDTKAGEEQFVIVVATVALPQLHKGGRLDDALAAIERQYRPQRSRRFEDGNWVKFSAGDDKDFAIVLHVPLRHA